MSTLHRTKPTGKHKHESSAGQHKKMAKARPVAFIALLSFLALIAASAVPPAAAADGPPIVNGLFYGDGDSAVYVPYSTSEHGSTVYVYSEGTTLYVALVIDRSVNDNVCSPRGDEAYPQDAGWTNHRNCKRLTDSEYVTFELTCSATQESWSWRQGYARKVDGAWISDNAIPEGGIAPPGYTSASSWTWNLNNYEANYPAVPWDLYMGGGPTADIANWKSPFDSNNPDRVLGLDAYPSTGPIGFSPYYQWEWPMVYEWSADVPACASGGLSLYLGPSHHSPIKNGDPDGNDDPLRDRGDLPDTYSTLNASNGPAHEFVLINEVYMGLLRDPELDGQPTMSATGDDADGISDEDGVHLGSQYWTNGNTVNIHISVLGSAPSADVGMWLDWDVNGTFECSEFYQFTDLTVGSTNTVQVTVPDEETYTVGDPVHMRVRIFDDESNAPGGSLDCTDFVGLVTNGEVEDYVWPFSPTAIFLKDVSAKPAMGNYPLLWLGLILLALVTTIALFRLSQRKTT